MAKIKQIINIETNLRFVVVIGSRICAPMFIAYLLMDSDEVYIHTVGPDEKIPEIGEDVNDESADLNSSLSIYYGRKGNRLLRKRRFQIS